MILGAVFIAAPFFYMGLYFKKVFFKTGQPKRILIIDNAKIGDLICATPVFRAIKEKYPDSYLVVLAIPRVEEILQNNQRIDKLIIASLNSGLGVKKTLTLFRKIKKENFNACINLVPGTLNFILPFLAGISLRVTSVNDEMGFFYRALSILAGQRLIYKKDVLSVWHYLDLLKFLGIKNNNLAKEVFVDASAQKKAAEFLAERGIIATDVVVGLCLSAGNKIKEWGTENFAKLANEISRCYNFKIMAIGGPADESLLKQFKQQAGENAIITYNDFSLKELPALIKKFNYFISVDTGPLYIANALGVPVVDIIGPCSLLDQPPIYEKCEAVYVDNLECWPCSSVIKTATHCRRGDLKCLKEISPELVLRSFSKLMEKYNNTN